MALAPAPSQSAVQQLRKIVIAEIEKEFNLVQVYRIKFYSDTYAASFVGTAAVTEVSTGRSNSTAAATPATASISDHVWPNGKLDRMAGNWALLTPGPSDDASAH